MKKITIFLMSVLALFISSCSMNKTYKIKDFKEYDAVRENPLYIEIYNDNNGEELFVTISEEADCNEIINILLERTYKVTKETEIPPGFMYPVFIIYYEDNESYRIMEYQLLVNGKTYSHLEDNLKEKLNKLYQDNKN